MSRRNWLLAAFVLIAAAQLAAPAWMIFSRERTLHAGKVFKFRTRPIDPVDAFRGHYVWLNLEPNEIKVADSYVWHGGQKAFAVLDIDTNGFAIVKRLEHAMPADEPAVAVETGWAYKGKMHIQWSGLDRYYMAEEKAPAAERAYREHSRATNNTYHVTVRVNGPQAALEELFIENQPVREWLR